MSRWPPNEHWKAHERAMGAREALEAAARDIEALTAGKDPYAISGEVLALHVAIHACADIVRRRLATLR